MLSINYDAVFLPNSLCFTLEDEFTTKKVCVYCVCLPGTWNIGTRTPAPALDVTPGEFQGQTDERLGLRMFDDQCVRQRSKNSCLPGKFSKTWTLFGVHFQVQ